MSESAPPSASRRLLLADPRGFCAGVDRAIEIVELALETYGPPIWVRHEIVHNRHVVEALRARGALFTDDLGEIPEGSLVVFSAHGVSPQVREEAQRRGLRTIDATCPLVTKVHVEALRYARNDFEIVLIGHRGHVEVEGTLGHARDRMHLVETVEDVEKLEVRDPNRLGVLTQTTLSVDDTAEILTALRARFPAIRVPAKDDICYATQNRQNAVKAVARDVDLVLIVGAPNSSNSQRLVEVAQACGADARLVESAADIDAAAIAGVASVAVSAGASAPDVLVSQVIARLRELGCAEAEEISITEESVRFTLPPELKRRLEAPTR
ncbi:MAG: 4-hydroxy-3-methylbut-2-enyl diphosphate reductase [Deltaproteobacteria bacterium]|nr:4-hydroxy-3-methylbut-2-enyl diphosphate reductase [Deltaproteobacteria bacterium]MBW2415407.1 4-hydroxy-3-methylbut-2-enyl diphosphate reductase [Deltaproteobacteria bacterium]